MYLCSLLLCAFLRSGLSLMVRVTTALRELANRGTFKSGLSDEQRAFVQAPLDESVVLIAAAGSGKTKSLLARFEHCLAQLADDARVHVISFSNSAALTFQMRWIATCGSTDGTTRVAQTLHSWTKAHVLRRAGVKEERVSYILPRGLDMLRRQSVQLGDLALLVDEAQDCCSEQLALLRELQRQGAHLSLVGDPRQSIYGFMHARPLDFISMAKTRFELTVNFRSTSEIVWLANSLAKAAGLGFTDQCAAPDAATGARPRLRCVHSMQHYHLQESLSSILTQPRERPACVLVRSNDEVDHMHQNLALLGYESLAILANNREGQEIPPLERALSASEGGRALVHVRTIHSCKGEEYDTVVLISKGFANEDNASEAFGRLNREDQEEAFRLMYVAATRACRMLHVLVVGARPCECWATVLRADAVAPPSVWPASKRNAPEKSCTPRKRVRMTLSSLYSKHHACDSLLAHWDRGEVLSGLAESDTGLGGQLADECHELDAPRLAASPARIQELSLMHAYEAVVRFVIIYHVAPTQTAQKLTDAITCMGKVPVAPQHLADLQRLADLDPNLCLMLAQCMVSLLTDGDACHVAQLARSMAAAQCRASGTGAGNPSYELASGRAFAALITAGSGSCYLGSLESASVRLVREHLQALLQRHKQQGEQVKCLDVFRERGLLFDSERTVRLRQHLIEHAQDAQARRLEGGHRALGGAALMCEFTAGLRSSQEAKAHRALPYLCLPRGNCLRLEQEVFLPKDAFLASCAQGLALRALLARRLRLGSFARGELECGGLLTVTPEKELEARVHLHIRDCLTNGGALSLQIAGVTQPTTVVEETRALVAHDVVQPDPQSCVALVDVLRAQMFLYRREENNKISWAATRLWANEH
jgi:hypothetical protein